MSPEVQAGKLRLATCTGSCCVSRGLGKALVHSRPKFSLCSGMWYAQIRVSCLTDEWIFGGLEPGVSTSRTTELPGGSHGDSDVPPADAPVGALAGSFAFPLRSIFAAPWSL